MSHSSDLSVLIYGLAGLVEALHDTAMECRQQRTFQTEDGKVHKVDAVITDTETGDQVGLRLDETTGKAEYVAHDCKSGGVRGKALAGRVVQRYAYVKAVEQLRRKGYRVTKEETKTDGTIAVVMQKWK